jgi:diacylglycerol kinase (ATP)
MRAAAILGLGTSEKDLKPFQTNSDATWLLGLPASSAEADAILIFGGDGTIHRHLAQLVDLRLPVLVVPCGSGNDFARGLKLRNVSDSLDAWRKFASGEGNLQTIDLGVIMPLEIPHQPKRIRRYFCCVGGAGLDSEVARRANQLPRWLRGHGGYVFSFLPALFRFAPLPMRILASENANPDELALHSAKPTALAAFANAPSYGGGMQIAPHARLDDGLLDICVVSDIDRFKLFCLFPTVYFGRHLSTPHVEYFQTAHLRVETEKPLAVYADGEYVCETPVEVGVERLALRVIVPSPGRR